MSSSQVQIKEADLLRDVEFPERLDAVDCSQSEFKSFERCRWRWFTKHVRNLRPKLAKPRLEIGRLFHAGLADIHDPLNPTPVGVRNLTWFQERLKFHYRNSIHTPEQDSGSAIWKALVDLSVSYAKEGPKPLKTFWATEVDFKIPIWHLDRHYEPVRFAGFVHGRLDVVDRLDDGIWITDYKTKKRFITKSLELDEQISIYDLVGAKMFGSEFRGVRLRFIRTPSSKSSPNYMDIPFVRSAAERHFIECEVAAKLDAMGEANPRSISWSFKTDCGWDCDYLDVCRRRRAGLDWETYLFENFEPRKDEEDLEGEPEDQ